MHPGVPGTFVREGRSAARTLLRCCGLLLLAASCCGAQTDAGKGEVAPDAAAPNYTLHVYEDLVQVAALVLDPARRSYAGLSPQDLTVRLDSGPPFHPRHMRLEGDDAVNLGVLLDDSDSQFTRTMGSAKSAPAWVPGDLGAQDRVSVFAFDCNLVASTRNGQLLPDDMPGAISHLLLSPSLHRTANDPHSRKCRAPINLWDGMAVAAKRMHSLPGRHVLVVISTGQDHGSVTSWPSLREYLSGASIATFGLRLPDETTEAYLRVHERPGVEDPWNMLCNLSGGLVLPVTPTGVDTQLQHVVDLVRQRYILEFARPNNGSAGIHRIDVTYPRRHGITVLTTGVTMPVRDKKLMDDPTTVPNDPSRSPMVGDRKILAPH